MTSSAADIVEDDVVLGVVAVAISLERSDCAMVVKSKVSYGTWSGAVDSLASFPAIPVEEKRLGG